MLSLVWFKRDLRVIDHPAIALAATQGAVLPVYIVEPDLWAQPDASGRQWAFATDCLTELRRDLGALGQPLVVRVGEAVDVLARLHAKHRFDQIVVHEEAGNAWSHARDQRVRAWAQDIGLAWIEVAPAALAPLAAVPALTSVCDGTGALPSARSLRLPEDHCPYRQKGGRAAAVVALEGFLASRAKVYAGANATLLAAERTGSRLSPYLAFGVLSLREVALRVVQEKEMRRGLGDWAVSLRRFEKTLRQCGPLQQDAAAQPGPDNRAAQTLPPDPQHLAAWRSGATGLPFIDACLRNLQATGWLDAGSRALVAGFGVHHLRLGVDAVGLHLARQCTDYAPAIHWRALAEVAAGRVPDPVAQGRRLDPDGLFIRRWLPELARVPAAHLHAPWLWPGSRGALAGRYPEPLVDPANAGRAARARQPRRLRAIAAPRQSVAAGQMALDF